MTNINTQETDYWVYTQWRQIIGSIHNGDRLLGLYTMETDYWVYTQWRQIIGSIHNGGQQFH